MALPCDAIGLSAICDCGISGSHALFFTKKPYNGVIFHGGGGVRTPVLLSGSAHGICVKATSKRPCCHIQGSERYTCYLSPPLLSYFIYKRREDYFASRPSVCQYIPSHMIPSPDHSKYLGSSSITNVPTITRFPPKNTYTILDEYSCIVEFIKRVEGKKRVKCEFLLSI